MSYRFSSIFNSVKTLYAPMKYPLVLIAVITSCQIYAAPSNMGSITVTSRNLANGTASGTYIAAGSKAIGSFTLTRNDTRGYNGVLMNPTLNNTGTNGIEISNLSDTSVSNDRFTYTFTITPDDNTSIHTIRIGQASYTTTGNSEVARHTISDIIQNSAIDIPTRLYVKDNPSVQFYYDAMGDYFMGRREGNTSIFRYNVDDIPEQQVRSNSRNDLYFFKINELAGNNLTGTRTYQPSTIGNEVRFANSTSRGVLPDTPTFSNILKSTSTNPNNQNTFTALSNNQTINGNSYVTYGVENSKSGYSVAVRNALSVTLTYEGIMNGSNGFTGRMVGETYSEWISFGVESTPFNYIFSGTVFNDNGAINDIDAKAGTIGGIYANSKYFNGKFDNPDNPDNTASSAPYELGITGSTVKLVDCTTGASLKDNISTDSNGKYEIIIPITSVASRSEVCLIEEMSGGSYPIRTTTNKKTVNLVQNTYAYKNNNFGRVIEANKALVLEKEQAINDCKISTLVPSDNKPAYSKSSLSDIPPGQCIAYKITATNRANLIIEKAVVTDELQQYDPNNPNGPKVTSSLVKPARTGFPAISYSDNLKYGGTGTLITSEFNIPARKNQIIYFNTKYGTTQSN